MLPWELTIELVIPNQALKGSIAEGFEVVRISENFAKWLEEEEPLPKPGVCTES